MQSLIIRPSTAEDAELIADLSRQTFYDSFAAQNTKEDMDQFMRDQFGKEKLMKEVEEGSGIYFLALDGANALGYVFMRDGKRYPWLGNASSIEIARIYAVQTAIGKGVGNALLKKSIEKANELKKEIIWLGVWEHNKRAIGFYLKWGFEKTGEHEFILGRDVQTDWLMKKNLDYVR